METYIEYQKYTKISTVDISSIHYLTFDITYIYSHNSQYYVYLT